MILGVDPKVDYAFKHLFGRESSQPILIDVLDSILLPSPALDIWLYFLRHAEKMDAEALPPNMEQPLVRRALEDLKMLTQTDLERERYEARRKAQLDHNSMINAARREGEEKWREALRLEKINVIRLCQRILNKAATPTEQLATYSLEELTKLAEEMLASISIQSSTNS